VRYGGDEFLVICEGEIDIVEVHKRLKESLKVDNPYNISFSIGTSTGEEGENIYDVIKRADCALYAVKAEGRDNLKVFENM
jgi:diguanylate cyclase (GGDEF)-like protein